MRHVPFLRGLVVCSLFASAVAMFGSSRRAGLWEFTSTTTWQKAPAVPGAEGNRLNGGTRTSQVCLTEEMIDEYGALLPQSRGQCSIENKQVDPGKITADYVCSGLMTGHGLLKSEWTDMEHVRGTVHFIGTLRVGSGDQPVEWTTESNGVFKSADCGSVKPHIAPQPRR